MKKAVLPSGVINEQDEEVGEHMKIGIVGAGLMGCGIAAISLQKGFQTILVDNHEGALQKARTLLENTSKTRLNLNSDLKSLSDCEIVIEAIYEDLELKRQLIRSLESIVKPTCAIASNTSAIPIAQLSQYAKHPERIVGMHYFSPVPKMPLLEIVRSQHTNEKTLSMALGVGKKQGKTSIVVQDNPGFYTTRILAPFLDEAMLLALEGIPLLQIDHYAQEYGFKVGPITLMDEVGIDVVVHVCRFLGDAFGERVSTTKPEFMRALLAQQLLGKKVKRGFYVYHSGIISWLKGKKRPCKTTMRLIKQYQHRSPLRYMTKQDIIDRLVMRMLNEAVYCLEDRTISTPKEGDIGAVLGIGFPDSKGGPFQNIEHMTAKTALQTLQRLTDTFGDRFQPSQLFTTMA